MSVSKHLNEKQIRGLEKLGDALLPGSVAWPSFSKSRCSRHVDRILDFMPAKDLEDLKGLLSVMGILPRFLIQFVIWFLERSLSMPGPLGGVLRFARIGIRGLVMSLYYGDPEIHGLMGYQVSVYRGDLSGSQPQSSQPTV